jgi:hypothetical protein
LAFLGYVRRLKESYSGSMALSPDGGIWVKHGDFRGIELLDGYSLREQPDPDGYGLIQCAPDCTGWMWSGGALRRLVDSSSWCHHPLRP